jgi:hypothetical protein
MQEEYVQKMGLISTVFGNYRPGHVIASRQGRRSNLQPIRGLLRRRLGRAPQGKASRAVAFGVALSPPRNDDG